MLMFLEQKTDAVMKLFLEMPISPTFKYKTIDTDFFSGTP